jgi:competence CoiA-like predicted nuclease
MFTAKKSDGKRIDVSNAIDNPNEKYYCEACNRELIIKNGSVRIEHFAHKTKCLYDYLDNDMSEWHREWQLRFPAGNREIVLKLNEDSDLIKHKVRRADILCYGYAIEFQNSPISWDEFDERNGFYNRLGYKVVWIFNLIDEYYNKKIEYYDEWRYKGDNGAKYKWKYASKTFSSYNPKNKNVILLFQMADYNKKDMDEDQGYLERVTWAINYDSELCVTDFKRFQTSYYPSNFIGLLDMMKRKIL